MRGRAAFVYYASSVDTVGRIPCECDGTLLPAVTDQIGNFYTPPALLPSLEKGGDDVTHSFNCPPPVWRDCVLLEHLFLSSGVRNYNSSQRLKCVNV